MEPPSTPTTSSNPILKCFNCAEPATIVPPLKGNKQNDNHNHVVDPTDSRFHTICYVMSPSEHHTEKLKEQLKPGGPPTCAKCRELITRIMELRDTFRQATAKGSTMDKIQGILMTNSKTSSLKRTSSFESVADTGSSSGARWFTGNGREMRGHAPWVPNSKLPLAPREVYEDWRQAFSVAQLIMECLRREGHRKQTMGQISEYILYRRNDFFQKNREQNVIFRILRQFFFNSTEYKHTWLKNKFKSDGKGKVSEVRGSDALWTINRDYDDIELIHKELRMSHSPLQPRPQFKYPNPRHEEPRPPAVQKADEPSTSSVIEDKDKEAPVPAKVRRTESGSSSRTSTGEDKDDGKKNRNSDTKEKVQPESESEPESQQIPKPSTADVEDPIENIRSAQTKLEESFNTTKLTISKLGSPKDMDEALKPTVVDTFQSILHLARNLYMSLDMFLIQTSNITRKPALTAATEFQVDVQAEYFRSLVRSEIYLKQATNSHEHHILKLAVVFDILKLKLLRLLAFDLHAKNKVSEKLATFGTRYFANIVNCLKWKPVNPITKERVLREDWAEDGLAHMLQAWSLIMFLLEQLQNQKEKDKDAVETSIDMFAVNLDHKEMGPQGFKEQLDKLNKALNAKPNKPSKPTTKVP